MPVRIPLDALLADGGGVIVVRRHPEHRRSLYRLVEQGPLTTILPGILAPTEAADRLDLRIRALGLWDDDAVLTRWAAARLTYWPELDVPMITGALPGRRSVPSGFEVVREAVPRLLVRTVGGLQVTAPALTALDLAPFDHGASIDRLLRTGLATIEDLDDALDETPGRRANQVRRRWLTKSRRRPWSPSERELHDLLKTARIDGWLGNCAIMVGSIRYVVDLVFREARVAIEVDGYEYHRAERWEQFHRDRRKWTDLAADGWTVLHFTWPQLTEDPDWVLASIRKALAASRLRRAA
ncbi:endonuclease domain-containing protein [Microlunatus sp. GCM10028923]|uniref:endonuclease domain-containing protein n=1 Tax=Microlunatus sp. GCM10028923 TaxID=3273400 RepID=UPI003612DF98